MRSAVGILALQGAEDVKYLSRDSLAGLSKNTDVCRIKARVENAAYRNIDGHLKGRCQIDRDAQAYQNPHDEIHHKEDRCPSNPVRQKSPFVAPAGNGTKEQRLHNARVVPANQNGAIPKQCRKDKVENGKHDHGFSNGVNQGRHILRISQCLHGC